MGMVIKRIRVDELKTGMYVHDLACGWLQHGFLLQRFPVRNPSQIEKLLGIGLKELYIDTERGHDVVGAPTEAEIKATLQQQLKSTANEGAALALPRVSQRQEAAAARHILGEASEVVDDLLHDVRLGRQVNPTKAGPLVREISDSVLRNPGALLSLCRIKEADTYTFKHCVSICALMVSFSSAMGMDQATVQEAGLGGLLHDIGKMRIPNSILNKPGKLTEEEFTIMKTHAPEGVDLLLKTPGLSSLTIQIVAEHHERMGGGGYPRGLVGERISEMGRMAAIVDVYDALTSNRVYHKGQEPTEVLRKLLEWSHTHLDGDLVQHFIRILGIYPVGTLVRLSSDRLAVVVEQGEDLLRPTVRLVYNILHRLPIRPRDLHLQHSHDHIVDFEEPEQWGLYPATYL